MAHQPTILLWIGMWVIGGTTVTTAQAEKCCPGYHTPYYDYDIYKIDSLVQEVTMSCSHKVVPAPDDAVPVGWILPDLRIVDYNSTTHNPKFKISEDGWQLTVSGVDHADIGLYHCMTEYQLQDDEADEFRWWLVKMGLNSQGPYFEDLLGKHRMNSIKGLSSFYGFLFLYLSLWAVWRLRWRSANDVSPRPMDKKQPFFPVTANRPDGHTRTGQIITSF